MSNYRRARVAGATYFFTVNLHERSSDSLVREIELLRATVRATKARHPFISMLGWCCRSTCIGFGRYPRAMQILLCAGR
jgi:REP element-mobilizing transposase RayT